MNECRSPDADQYQMVYREPHRELEPLQREIEVVEQALTALCAAGILSHTRYDHAKFTAHREAIREHFDIPWTGITPRMQRLLYAINASAQPANMLAAGVFCGNTFISNAGAAIGPGACYDAENLIGVEIKPEEAARAQRNMQHLAPAGAWRIMAADAIDVVRDFPHPIHLLYLDASDETGKSKGIYLDILKAALDRLHPGALVLAHNSLNCAERLRDYFAFVRSTSNFTESLNVIIDREGLEVSMR